MEKIKGQKKMVLMVMMLLVTAPVFAEKFDFGDFMQKLDRVVPKVETRRQYESRQPTIEVYEEEKEEYQAPPVVYKKEEAPVVYQKEEVQPIVQGQIGKNRVDKSNDWLIPLLIVGLAILVVEVSAIWYLDKKLYVEFGYDIKSPGKLFLFGVQTVPLVILAVKGMFAGLTALEVVFGLGFFAVAVGLQFYIDKKNTNVKYAVSLLFVRLIASVYAVVVVIILIAIAIFAAWIMAMGKKDNELSPDEVTAVKKLISQGRVGR